MKLLLIVLSTTLSFSSANAGMMKDIKRAKKAYRAWKEAHPNEDVAFKARFKAMKQSLRDEKSDLAISVKLAKSVCASDQSSCNDAIRTMVLPEFTKSMGTSSAQTTVLSSDPAIKGIAGGGFHAVIFGSQYGGDTDGDENRIKNFGPGAWLGGNLLLATCSDGASGVNYGFSAAATYVAGAQVGIYFGEDGICGLLGINVGFGAFLGYSVISFEG